MSFVYKDKVSELEQKYGIQPGLYHSLLTLGERSGQNAVSPKGAIGFAQLMPGTAAELGVNPWDPEQNLEGGAKYFKKMYDKFGDWKLALAAYNAGPGAVEKAGGVPNFKETQAYVQRVMGMDGTTPGGAMPGPVGMPVSEAEKAAMARYQATLDHGAEVNKQAEEKLKAVGERISTVDADIQRMTNEPRPKPPTIANLPDAPGQDDYIKDPTRVLGQILPGLTILGSLTMRNGAMNAMKAATAAMNAARQRDEESYKRAHEDWKAKMEETLRQADLERQQYLDVLEDRKLSMTEKLSELNTLSAAGGNAQMQAMIANGQTGEIYKQLQMMDALSYRGYQVLDMTKRREMEAERLNLDKQRVALEEQKAKDLTQYRSAQIKVAEAKNDKQTMSQLVASLNDQKRKAANGEGTWTPADEQALAESTATLQRMNFGAPGGAAGAPEGPKVSDVDYLKANDTPPMREAFDKKFGPGAAKKYLGY